MKFLVAAPKPSLDNANGNKLQPQDRAIHDWYRFVLSFPPHLVRDCFQRIGVEAGACVLDPFAGTGTTLVEAKQRGLRGVGLESHPMGHFACTVKTDWAVDPARLISEAERVAEATAAALGRKSLFRGCLALFEDETDPASSPLRTLPPEQQALLLKNSISPRPLHKALVLRDQIETLASPRIRGHLLLALAKTVVEDASNLHFGPEVGLGEIREDAPVLESWLEHVYAMACDLRQVPHPNAEAVAFRADARCPSVLEHHSVDIVITSPPYPNEKDYTRTTRLETVLLGFLKTKEDLRRLKAMLLRSNTRNIYKGDDDDQWVSPFESVQRLAAAIEERRHELGKTSGFERLYHRVTKHYFGGLAKHLANQRALLRPNARLAYVVGDQASFFRVMIRTGQILAEIAEYFGYRVEGIELFRTRLATATRSALREEIVWLTWPAQRRSHE
jgi:hypothetical protein